MFDPVVARTLETVFCWGLLGWVCCAVVAIFYLTRPHPPHHDDYPDYDGY